MLGNGQLEISNFTAFVIDPTLSLYERNSKFEFRNSKQILNTNVLNTKTFCHSNFGIASDF